MSEATDTSLALFDFNKVEDFSERMLGVLNDAGLALMLSLGHRTGLFDRLAEMPPATSEEIASRARLNERYVREWLGAMVTGRVVEFDEATGKYQLPAEHAEVLTRAGQANFGMTAQWIAVLAGVEDGIVECFRKGGGVPYASFHRFHEVMAEESGQTVVAALEEHILPLVPGLVEQLQAGGDVLDVGCGSGRALLRMAELFPKSRFTGYDLGPDAIAAARGEARRRGLANVRFEEKDVACLGETARFDLITAFDIVHDQAKPAEVLKQIHAALRPTGTFLMQDIDTSSHLPRNLDHKLGTFLYTVSCMHCMTVSLAQGGAGLGTCWGTDLAEKMLRQTGFREVNVHRLPHDIINAYYIVKK